MSGNNTEFPLGHFFPYLLIFPHTEQSCGAPAFCTTVCLITELIYLPHYLFSSPGIADPDENSDYCSSMSLDGKLSLHCSELRRKVIIQRDTVRQICSLFHLCDLTLGTVFGTVSVLLVTSCSVVGEFAIFPSASASRNTAFSDARSHQQESLKVQFFFTANFVEAVFD